MSSEPERQRAERTPEPDRPLPASMDYESPRPPDYPNQYREPTPKQLAVAATARRLEREEISVTSGLVAGHDFKREAQDRERGRQNGRGRGTGGRGTGRLSLTLFCAACQKVTP